MIHAAIAVTTQVCEMSLDLDADVLITELAPSPALVQRLGRANRHLARGPGFRARVIITPAPREAPYQPAQLARARAMVDAVTGDSVSQQMLADALVAHSVEEAEVLATARFLTAGYYAIEGSLRDESDHLAAAVLDSDLDELNSRLARKQPIDGFLLSAPRKALLPADERPSWLPRYVGVVDAGRYDADLGFLMGDST